MNWWLLLAAVIWFGCIEFIRGRPQVSGTTSLVMMLLAPLGTIVLVVLAFVVD